MTSQSAPTAHPHAIDLQRHACGEDVASVSAHIAECNECLTYVERARGVAGSPRSSLPRLTASRRAARLRGVVAFASATLPLAAGIAVWVASAKPAGSDAPLATAPPSVAPLGTGEPETTFKGGIQLAVIRERDGRQERFTGSVAVKPGDRLRVEVALDRQQSILGAVVGEDGSYVEILSVGARDAGTYFSDKSVRIDDRPLRGTVLVGTPDAVARARRSTSRAGVGTLAVEWEAP